MHPPKDVHRPPFLVIDKPWETNRIWAYNSIVENGTHVLLYYHVFADAAQEDPSRLCLAVSSDNGKTFTKPNLGHIKYKGADTNIVFGPSVANFPGFGANCGGGGCEPGAVFIDTNPQAPPEEKFKVMIFGPAHGGGGVWPFTSPDGIRWTIASKSPIYLDSDTQQVPMYLPEQGKYVVYMRSKVLQPGYPNRTCSWCVGQSEVRADGLCKPHCGVGVHAIRAVGRCESASFAGGWAGCAPTNAKNVVFGFDMEDHPCIVSDCEPSALLCSLVQASDLAQCVADRTSISLRRSDTTGSSSCSLQPTCTSPMSSTPTHAAGAAVRY